MKSSLLSLCFIWYAATIRAQPGEDELQQADANSSALSAWLRGSADASARFLTSAQYPWWRLICNVQTLDTWRVCNIQYFLDRACSASTASPLEETVTECFPCSGGTAYVTTKFSSVVEVQCIVYSECTTTTNLAVGGGFGQILQGQSECGQVALQRSTDGATWSSVGQWSNPQPGVQLVRTDGSAVATTTGASSGGGGSNSGGGSPATAPPSANLYVVSSQPVRVQNCDTCNGGGAQARSTLMIEFNEAVQLGSGSISLSRGSLGELPLLASSGWFSVSGAQLRIQPQQDLAGSGECVVVTIGSGAITNLNGQSLPADDVHRFCIVDSLPPQVTAENGWQPAQDQIVSQKRPELIVTFDEEVELAQSSIPAELVGTTTTGTEVIELYAADARVAIWNSFTGASEVIFTLPEDLQANSRYVFTIPSGFITDNQGNVWSGGMLGFDTDSFTTQVPNDSNSGVSSGGGSSDDGSGAGVIVGVAILLLVFCCCGAAFGVWVCFLKANQKQAKAPTPQPSQAWAQPVKPGTSSSFSPSNTKQGADNGDSLPKQAFGGDPGSPSSAKSYPSAASPPPAPPQGPRRAAQGDGSPTSPGGVPRRGSQDGAPSVGASKLPKANGQTFAERKAANAAPPPPRQRAYEAEDVQRESQRAPGPGFAKPQHTSFTEDDAAGGEWIKTVDKVTGRPYWYNCRTMETRWERPGAARERPGKPQADGTRQQASEADQKLGENLSNLKEAEEVARVKAELLEQLRKNRKEDLALRKKTFKFMCFQWHPDKNQDNQELATPVFQFLQEQKDWFLEEA